MYQLGKRVLIISSWAPPMIGGPMSLYNIFTQFSNSSYCLLTGYAAITTQVYDGNYWLGGKYYYYDRPDLDGTNPEYVTPALRNQTPHKKWWRDLLTSIMWIFRFKRIDVLIHMFLQTIIVVRRGIRVVKKEKINMLIGISGDGLSLISTYIIHKFTNTPYTLYLFDIYYGNKFVPSINWLAKIVEPIIVHDAKIIFVTNEGTRDHYIGLYGKDVKYEIIYNSVFLESYQKQRMPYAPQPPYSILFTGSIYWAQEQSVLNLIGAMKMLKDDDVHLSLYTPIYPQRIEDAVKGASNINITSASPSEMPAIQGNADLLFLPLAWNTPSPEIIATATPGKFTDYLGSGRPMLVHAPDYAYISRYARQHNLGLVVDTNDAYVLAQTIRNFLQHPASGEMFINNALATFHNNHDARKNAAKLARVLNTL